MSIDSISTDIDGHDEDGDCTCGVDCQCHENVVAGRHFAVVRLSDGKLVYRGQHMGRVAVWNEKGTAWAEGPTQAKADEAARELRQKLVYEQRRAR